MTFHRLIKIHGIPTLLVALGLLFNNEFIGSMYWVARIVGIGSFILYYDLTNRFNLKLAITSVIINMVLLQVELYFYMTKTEGIPVIENNFLWWTLGAILLFGNLNKLLIDIIFIKFNAKERDQTRMEFIIDNYKETGDFKYKPDTNA